MLTAAAGAEVSLWIVNGSVVVDTFPASSTAQAVTVSGPSGRLLASTLTVVAAPEASSEASTGGFSPPAISTCTRSFGSGSARCTTTGTEDASSPFTTSGAFAPVG